MQATSEAAVNSADDDSWRQDEAANVRLLKIPRAAPQIEEFGFRLTRSKWDPYPWVSEVLAGTPASLCGLTTGDCILKVNNVDIIGMRIATVAEIVKSQKDAVTFLCWSSDCKTDCDESSICCVPMPTSLKRLSVIVDCILRVIECPVCNVTITPPVMQCQNGHLLCLDCRIRSEKCPMCRGYFTPIRSGVAEQIYSIIAGAFESRDRRDGKLRHKIFGEMSLIKTKPNGEDCICRESLKQRKSLLPKTKMLSKLLQAKAGSLENLFQCNANAKLLRAEATESFNVMPLDDGCNEKRLEPRLTRASMLKCTNGLQQQQEPTPVEWNAKLQADTNSDSNHNCNEADSLGQQQDIVRRGAELPLVGEQNTVMAANAPSVVNELCSDPPVKTQSKCFDSPTSGVLTAS